LNCEPSKPSNRPDRSGAPGGMISGSARGRSALGAGGFSVMVCPLFR
jgi:hypothetical protein